MAEKRSKILFVDDEPDILLILEETFNDEYEVVTAPTGMAALDIIEAGGIDLLVTDQKMPSMSGVDLIEKVQQKLPELPCIMLTAYTDPPDLIEVINRGPVYRFISKPWDMSDLVQTVSNALAHGELRKENVELLAKTQRRLAALEAFYELSCAAVGLTTYAEIVDEVAGVLEAVVPLDVSATLIRTDRDQHAAVTLRCREGFSPDTLEALTDSVLEAHRTMSGEELSEDDVLVRVSGPGISTQPDAFARELKDQLFIPLVSEGQHAGMLVVGAYKAGAFDREDERILDILANQAAAAIAGLRMKTVTERHRLENLVDGMADGLIMTDAAGAVVVANPMAHVLLGVPADQPLTTSLLRDELNFYPFELVRGWERLGSHAVTEDVAIGERVLHSVVSPVTGPDGRLDGVVLVLRNVTDERALERQREQFVRDICHELRTPLTSVHGSIDIVLAGSAGDLNDKQLQLLTMTKGSLTKLNTMVDNLLDLSKAQTHLSLELEDVDLADLVGRAVDRYRPAFELEKITVAVQGESKSKPMRLDADRMDQVLNNLLTNAAKFTPEGGRIVVELFGDIEVGGTAGLSIWNSGDSIVAADLERIFEQFEQSDAPAPNRPRGTGLGLPICRRIIEGHGGRIWAESETGKGAAFIVALPVEAAQADADQVTEPSPGLGRAGDTAKVLVVDDDKATAYAVKGTLLAAGFNAEVAHSAQDALAVARGSRPGIMLIDIRMPDVDGVELIDILRHDPETRGTPIVAMSGLEEGVRAKRAGAHAFLSKPLDSARLISTLTQLAFGRVSFGQKILVVEDDAVTRAMCTEILDGARYTVAEAATAEEARNLVKRFRPDIVLLDVVLPDGDGFELLKEIRSDKRAISVVLMSVRSNEESRLRTMRSGGDDFLAKPFDEAELTSRVEAVLRRRELEMAASPSTALPGGLAADAEILRRIESGDAYTVCYLALDHLRAFNDFYGYPKADAVLQQTGALLREVVGRYGTPGDFIGHVSGNDFLVVTRPDKARAICEHVVASFDRIIPLYYRRADREAGFIEVTDRAGKTAQFPVLGINGVAVTDPGGRFKSNTEVAVTASALRLDAKNSPFSTFLCDDETRQATV